MNTGNNKRNNAGTRSGSFLNRVAEFHRNSEGSILPIFAMMAVLLIVAGGAGVDYTNAIRNREQLQSALDAAVLAGAAATENQISVAQDYFNVNTAGMDDINATAEFTRGSDRISGKVSAKIPASFIRLLGFSEIPVTVTAAASAEEPGDQVCIYVMSEFDSVAFKANGSGEIDMPDCDMHVHSKTSSATWIDSRNIDVQKLCVAGSLGGNARPWPEEFKDHCDVEDDPYEGVLPALSDELVAEESCVPAARMPDQNAEDMVFEPGTYCGNFPPINGNVKSVTFEPGNYVFKAFPTLNASKVVFGEGNYVFKGTTFQFNSSVQTVEMGAGVYVLSGGSEIRFDNQKITGSGVTIYLADGDSAFRTVQGSSIANLSAPESGPYAGILYYEAPNLTSASNFILDGTLNLKGIVHLPSRTLHLNGSGDIDGKDMVLVVNKLSLDGKISITNGASSSSSTSSSSEAGATRTRLLN